VGAHARWSKGAVMSFCTFSTFPLFPPACSGLGFLKAKARQTLARASDGSLAGLRYSLAALCDSLAG